MVPTAQLAVRPVGADGHKFDDIFVLEHGVAIAHGQRHLAADPSPKFMA